MSKRIIALLISLTLIMSAVFQVSVFADEIGAVVDEAVTETATETATDEVVDEEVTDPVVNAQLEKLAKSKAIYNGMIEEIGLLKSLGIMDDATEENMLEEVTRAQFVRYMLQFMNVEPEAASDEVNTYYLDVPVDYPYYKDITTATVMGIVNGGSNSVFNPNNTIAYRDAIKIVVGALEFGTLAEYRGGYPKGYIEVARDLKLEKNISIGYTENMTMEQLVHILFNALNSNSALITVSTSKPAISMGTGDRLYIEEKFNVEKYRGIVTGTSYTRRLEGEADLAKLEIGGTEYNIGNYAQFDEEEILGQEVYFYLKYPDGDMKDTAVADIIFVNPIEGFNKIVEVIDEDIQDTSSMSSLYYWDEKANTRNIDISDAIIYYNGKIDPTAKAVDLKPERGSVRAIDNDRDGKFEYVFIKNSVQRIVDVASREKIRYKFGLGSIDVPEKDSKILIFRYGAEITTDYLGEWEVLEVMLCKDGESGIIDVSKKVVEGQVNSVSNDEYKVAGVKYKLSKPYIEALKGDPVTGKVHYQAIKPKKNDTCAFILDSRGEIAAMRATLTQITEYGFLVKTASSGGLEKSNQVKMYCQYGVMNIFPVSDTVKINGKRLADGEDIESRFYNENKVFEPQLVRYTRNNGIVTQIDTADDTTGGLIQVAGTPEPDKFSLDYRDTTSWTYDGNSYMVEDTYIVLDDTTPVFWIPFDTKKDSLYHYYDSRSNLSGLQKTTDIYVYDSTVLEEYSVLPNGQRGVRTPGCIVIRTQQAENEITQYNPYTLETISASQNYYIVDEIETTGENSDGDPTYSITAAGNIVLNFESVVYNVDTSNLYGQGNYTLGDLEKGDIIQVGYGNDSSKANRFVCVATAYGSNQEKDNGYVDGNFRWWNNTRNIGDVDIETNAGNAEAFVIGEIIYIKNPYYVIRTKNSVGEEKILTLIYTTSGVQGFKMYEESSENVWDASYWEFETGQRVIIRIVNGKMSFGVMVTR